MAHKRRATLNEHQQAVMDRFFGLLREWDEGILTLRDVEVMGPDTYSLMGIRLATPIADPMNDLFCDYIERLCEAHKGAGVMTQQGWVSEAEIHRHGGRVTQIVDEYTGEVYEAAQFPIGYAAGIDGKPDKRSPIYGSPVKRRHAFEEELFEEDTRSKSEWFR